jgi:hypothetical protein
MNRKLSQEWPTFPVDIQPIGASVVPDFKKSFQPSISQWIPPAE